MTLKQQINDDVVTVFLNTDEFAETISYTPKDGVATSIIAVVIRKEDRAFTVFESETSQEQRITIEVSTAEVPNLIRGDKFTIDSTDYGVDSRPEQDGFGMMTVELIRIQPFEKGIKRIPR